MRAISRKCLRRTHRFLFYFLRCTTFEFPSLLPSQCSMDFALQNRSPSPPSPATGAVSVASPPPPASLSPRQLSQRRRRERERLCHDQTPLRWHSEHLHEHSEQQVRGRPLPPIILHDPYPRRRRTPSPPATRRSPSGRVPFESSPSPPSPPTGAVLVTSPPAPASLPPQQFSQRRRREREHLHCDQSPSSPPSPTTVPV